MVSSCHGEFADHVRPLFWAGEGLKVLDQRKLPDRQEFTHCTSVEQVAEAISTMQVRGAPAIGIAAAFGVALAVRRRWAAAPTTWRTEIESDFQCLARSRPTAVNLFWALDRMRGCLANLSGEPFPQALLEARRMLDQDVADNRRMGEFGADWIGDAKGILTHCNTGSLATGGYGTALGIIRSAVRRAPRDIYATETRPWLQGARLTIWELEQDGIPATLLADSAAASLMRTGYVQWVVVGADRITANGDVANKIGTYSLALLARQHGVRFMVAAPVSTIDWALNDGQDIELEQRDPGELLPKYFHRDNSLIRAWNPVFDVTPAELIDAIVTEHGVVAKPCNETLRPLRPPLPSGSVREATA